jgi:hypothetical protein
MNQATNCSHVFLPNYPLSSQSCPLSSKDYSFFFDKKKRMVGVFGNSNANASFHNGKF